MTSCEEDRDDLTRLTRGSAADQLCKIACETLAGRCARRLHVVVARHPRQGRRASAPSCSPCSSLDCGALTTVESAPAIAPPPPPKTAPPGSSWTLACASRRGRRGCHPAHPTAFARRADRRRRPRASREEHVEVATLFAGRLPGWEGPQATDPWTLAVDSDGGALKVYHAQHGPSLLFRVTATADADFAQTVALFREVDLLSQWNKGVAQAAVEETCGPTDMIAHALVNFPWPLPPSLIRLHARLHAGAAAAAAPPSVFVATSPDGAAAAAGARVSARGARRAADPLRRPPHAAHRRRRAASHDGGCRRRSRPERASSLDAEVCLRGSSDCSSVWCSRGCGPAKASAALGAKETSRWEPAAAERCAAASMPTPTGLRIAWRGGPPTRRARRRGGASSAESAGVGGGRRLPHARAL